MVTSGAWPYLSMANTCVRRGVQALGDAIMCLQKCLAGWEANGRTKPNPGAQTQPSNELQKTRAGWLTICTGEIGKLTIEVQPKRQVPGRKHCNELQMTGTDCCHACLNTITQVVAPNSTLSFAMDLTWQQLRAEQALQAAVTAQAQL
eukprot:1156446-Pelagomonas_calceolata.AAC.1